MTVTTLFFLSLALSADAFTVAVCKGLSLPRRSLAAACTVGAWFGLFQGLMPVFGYLVGALFEKTVSAYGHIVSFVLLSVIGLQFIKDARQKNTPESLSASLSPLSVLPLAVATSIDAFAIGITLPLHPSTPLFPAAALIGLTTCLLCTLGVALGNRFGTKNQKKAKIFGGALLILLGVRFLFEGF